MKTPYLLPSQLIPKPLRMVVHKEKNWYDDFATQQKVLLAHALTVEYLNKYPTRKLLAEFCSYMQHKKHKDGRYYAPDGCAQVLSNFKSWLIKEYPNLEDFEALKQNDEWYSELHQQFKFRLRIAAINRGDKAQSRTSPIYRKVVHGTLVWPI